MRHVAALWMRYRMFTPSRASSVVFLLSLASPTLAADLLGRLTQGGKPRANVEVTLQRDGSKSASDEKRASKTDAAGNFAFTGIAPGSYKLNCGGTERPVNIRAGGNRLDCKD